MTERTYAVAPAKIGNAAGFRLPASFYRDHPQFANAGGWVEVLTEDTVLIKLDPQPRDSETDEDDLMMSLFLDFATKDALTNPQHLETYTQEMSDEDDELLTGVTVDR
jgi:antitoxin PrlF